MKISFLVTYYNQKEYVRQSLDSILNIEKPCDWEILVGDDGSSDGTVEIVKEYMAKYPDNIFLYIMDREPGKKYEVVRRASANRLNLLRHATGDFFCTLDGDDNYCSTTFVAQALEIFQKEKDVSVVAFGYRIFSEEVSVIAERTLPAGPLSAHVYLGEGMFTHTGACVHKNAMDTARLDFLEKIGYFDDNNIVVNSLFYGNIYAVDQVIYGYRQTENSIYNSMAYAEKAVLNVQSYDVDIQLLAHEEPAIALRYGVCVMQAYLLRKRLKDLLGDQKWQQYRNSCQKLEGGLSYVLLEPAKLTPQIKRRIRQIIRRFMFAHPRVAVRTVLQCWKYRT